MFVSLFVLYQNFKECTTLNGLKSQGFIFLLAPLTANYINYSFYTNLSLGLLLNKYLSLTSVFTGLGLLCYGSFTHIRILPYGLVLIFHK